MNSSNETCLLLSCTQLVAWFHPLLSWTLVVLGAFLWSLCSPSYINLVSSWHSKQSVFRQSLYSLLKTCYVLHVLGILPSEITASSLFLFQCSSYSCYLLSCPTQGNSQPRTSVSTALFYICASWSPMSSGLCSKVTFSKGSRLVLLHIFIFFHIPHNHLTY
jgi:hypothetical protein